MQIADLDHLEDLAEISDACGGATSKSTLSLTLTNNVLSLTFGNTVLYQTQLPAIPTAINFSPKQGSSLLISLSNTGNIGSIVSLLSYSSTSISQ